MAVRIRLSRVGKRNRPYYRIVAMPAEAKRDGQALEILGTYDPVRHELIRYYNDRVDAWVSQGAKMSNAVRRLKKLYTPQSQEQKHDAA